MTKTSLESLPQKRMAAGLLVRDSHGQILAVQPSYKPSLEISQNSMNRLAPVRLGKRSRN